MLSLRASQRSGTWPKPCDSSRQRHASNSWSTASSTESRSGTRPVSIATEVARSASSAGKARCARFTPTPMTIVTGAARSASTVGGLPEVRVAASVTGAARAASTVGGLPEVRVAAPATAAAGSASPVASLLAGWLRHASASVGEDPGLDQDPRELATAGQDVVRPLEPGLDARRATKRLGDGYRCRDRERGQERGRYPGPDEDRGEQARPGGVVPRPAPPPSSRGLVVRDDDRAVGGAPGGEPERGRLRGLDGSETDDRDRASGHRATRGSP